MKFSEFNFDAMTGSQLVAAYNEMAREQGLSPVAKFSDKATAVKRCKKAQHQVTLAIKPHMVQMVDEARAAKSVAIAPTKPASRVAQVESRKKNAKSSAEGRDARRIFVTLDRVGTNPRREGTDAHRHFEAMRGEPTVAEYLEKFAADRRKVARHWLYNTVRDGYVEVR